MKRIFCISFTVAISLQSMKHNSVTLNDLKPFLKNEISILPNIIEKIDVDDTRSNKHLMYQCIHYATRINSNNPYLLAPLVPIFFNAETIDRIKQDETPLEYLFYDCAALNKALYGIPGTKNVFTYYYNIGFRMIHFLNKRFVRILKPLKKEDSYYSNFIRINGKNFIAILESSDLNEKETFIKINDLSNHDKIFRDDITLNKIEYYKASLEPTFHSEAISENDVAFYKKQILTLLCYFKNYPIKIPKSVINNCIIPCINPEIFTKQSSLVYKDIQKQMTFIKNMRDDEVLKLFDKTSHSFFMHNFNVWYEKKMKKLINFNNVKLLFEHHL